MGLQIDSNTCLVCARERGGQGCEGGIYAVLWAIWGEGWRFDLGDSCGPLVQTLIALTYLSLKVCRSTNGMLWLRALLMRICFHVLLTHPKFRISVIKTLGQFWAIESDGKSSRNYALTLLVFSCDLQTPRKDDPTCTLVFPCAWVIFTTSRHSWPVDLSLCVKALRESSAVHGTCAHMFWLFSYFHHTVSRTCLRTPSNHVDMCDYGWWVRFSYYSGF
jgi:hypothetical protein